MALHAMQCAVISVILVISTTNYSCELVDDTPNDSSSIVRSSVIAFSFGRAQRFGTREVVFVMTREVNSPSRCSYANWANRVRNAANQPTALQILSLQKQSNKNVSKIPNFTRSVTRIFSKEGQRRQGRTNRGWGEYGRRSNRSSLAEVATINAKPSRLPSPSKHICIG